ncbi:hypothetical protein A2U01_0038990, partial [Trifolium medium]|nr:hypothetical protein [Trifolium medium]
MRSGVGELGQEEAQEEGEELEREKSKRSLRNRRAK